MGRYSHRFGGFGNLSASFIGTLLRHYKVDNGLTPEYDCAGLYGPVCSERGRRQLGADAEVAAQGSRDADDAVRASGLSLQWRHVGKVKAKRSQNNETLHGEFNCRPGPAHQGAELFRPGATYHLVRPRNLRAGVNNIFDKDPPLVTGGSAAFGIEPCPAGPCNGNTYPGTWDALGRYLYAGVTIDFKHRSRPRSLRRRSSLRRRRLRLLRRRSLARTVW